MRLKMVKGDAATGKFKVSNESDWFITEGYRPGKQLGNLSRRDGQSSQFIEARPPKGGTSGVRSQSNEVSPKRK
jgi:hypothetical protein